MHVDNLFAVQYLTGQEVKIEKQSALAHLDTLSQQLKVYWHIYLTLKHATQQGNDHYKQHDAKSDAE